MQEIKRTATVEDLLALAAAAAAAAAAEDADDDEEEEEEPPLMIMLLLLPLLLLLLLLLVLVSYSETFSCSYLHFVLTMTNVAVLSEGCAKKKNCQENNLSKIRTCMCMCVCDSARESARARESRNCRIPACTC